MNEEGRAKGRRVNKYRRACYICVLIGYTGDMHETNGNKQVSQGIDQRNTSETPDMQKTTVKSRRRDRLIELQENQSNQTEGSLKTRNLRPVLITETLSQKGGGHVD